MNLPVSNQTRQARVAAYVDGLAEGLSHADRIAPMQAYCTGLLLPGERKSIEPMAARLEPERVQAAHQSLHHLIAQAEWSDQAVLAIVREQVLPALERHGDVRASPGGQLTRNGVIWRGSLASDPYRRLCRRPMTPLPA